jgi:hypothetical protein
MDKKFLIWSIERDAWWAPAWNGYRKAKKDAGIYSFEEALKILREANLATGNTPNEAIVPYEG